MIYLCVLLCELLIQEKLIEGEPEVELQLLGADLDVVLEQLARVEVVRVAPTLKGQVCESQGREGLLEVQDLKLQDVVHCVKSEFEWRLEGQGVQVRLLLVSKGTLICRDILYF